MGEAPRVYELERLVGNLARELEAVKRRLAAAEQQLAQVWGLSWPATSGGGGVALWCKATFAAASGTWDTITPTTATVDVYKDVGGVPTLETSGATVRWFYLDASGANKLIPVIPNGDGTYDAVAASCTAV